MVAILFDGAKPFEQIGNTLLTEGPMWNLVKIAQAVKRRRPDHHFNKLGRAWVLDALYQDQPQSFLGSGEEDFKNFYNTVDSRYLELQGTLWNTSRYPYFDISDLQNWRKQLIEQPP